MIDIAKLWLKKMKKKLPQATYTTEDCFEDFVLARDGMRLKTSVICPDRQQKWPVIVIRNPYLSGDELLPELTMKLFSSCGYAAVYVRVRGTLGSQGEWLPFKHEREDGRDVIDWIAKQYWCDGNIGTYGQSYLGHTQWSIADYDHPMLKTMFISVYGTNPYETFYRRGMFRQEVWTEWAAQMLPCNKDLQLPAKEGIALRKKAFATYPQNQLGEAFGDAHCKWYEEWLTSQKETDPCWGEGFWKEFRHIAPKVKVPVYLHGGWFDIFLRSQICAWRELPEETRKKSRFIIGPWHHAGLPGGDLKYPGEKKAGFMGFIVAIPWFEHYLKQKEYSESTGVIESYEIGTNQWKLYEDDLPSNEELHLYFCAESASKKKYIQHDMLAEKGFEEGVLSFVYDPKHPVDSCGGTLIANHHKDIGWPECSCYQPKAQSRDDVISFYSDTMKEDMIINGSIRADLFVSSDAEATAFTVKIIEEFSNGKAVNIRDDISDIRWRNEEEYKDYTPRECVELKMKMLDINWKIKKGSRIRVDVSSSNYPAYHVHPNTAEPWYELHENRIATQTVYCGGEHASRIIVPIKKQ